MFLVYSSEDLKSVSGGFSDKYEGSFIVQKEVFLRIKVLWHLISLWNLKIFSFPCQILEIQDSERKMTRNSS